MNNTSICTIIFALLAIVILTVQNYQFQGNYHPLFAFNQFKSVITTIKGRYKRYVDIFYIKVKLCAFII